MSNALALVIFNLFVLGMLALDLWVFQRRPREVSFKEAAAWSGLWVALSLAFNVALYFWRGPQPALEFLTGYVLEKSLSLDNIFAFTMIFSYASVSTYYQHRILFWGILGALVIRGAFIAAGVALVARFHWILYLFGALLVVTGATTLGGKRRKIDLERNHALRLVRKVFPITESYQGPSFFVRRKGKLMATPLLLVIVLVETADLIFALDSIPAVFAVTLDPFIVYTSNVFAVLGLRAMYSLLAGALARFHYLRAAISLVLMFAGSKMLLSPFFRIPLLLTLAVIPTTLVAAILASLRAGARGEKVYSK